MPHVTIAHDSTVQGAGAANSAVSWSLHNRKQKSDLLSFSVPSTDNATQSFHLDYTVFRFYCQFRFEIGIKEVLRSGYGVKPPSADRSYRLSPVCPNQLDLSLIAASFFHYDMVVLQLPELPELSPARELKVYTHKGLHGLPKDAVYDEVESADNQRLALLGDAVLQLVVTQIIMKDRPLHRVGPLSVSAHRPL